MVTTTLYDSIWEVVGNALAIINTIYSIVFGLWTGGEVEKMGLIYNKMDSISMIGEIRDVMGNNKNVKMRK